MSVSLCVLNWAALHVNTTSPSISNTLFNLVFGLDHRIICTAIVSFFLFGDLVFFTAVRIWLNIAESRFGLMIKENQVVQVCSSHFN